MTIVCCESSLSLIRANRYPILFLTNRVFLMFIVLCLRRDHKISSFYSTEQNLAQMHCAQFNRIAQVNSRKKLHDRDRD